MRRIRFRAFLMGLRDGWQQGASFSSGITWTEGEWLEARGYYDANPPSQLELDLS
jgi:hypothetical protein